MDDFLKRYGSWGLVAGAAEGLGEAYCTVLAEKGMNIILVDKEKEAMDKLAVNLQNAYGIQTNCLHLDLAETEAPGIILNKVTGIDCRLLIYNAAYSEVKPILKHSAEELDGYIDVNCRTLIKTVHGFADQLKNKPSGGILLMSSLAGLWGTQLVAPYGATKAFTLNLAESLYHELKQYNIDIMACIAGATSTPAYLLTNPEYGTFKPSVMDADKVASYAIRKLGKRPYCIPGSQNKFTYFLMTHILCRKAASGIINKTMGRMYKHTLES